MEYLMLYYIVNEVLKDQIAEMHAFSQVCLRYIEMNWFSVFINFNNVTEDIYTHAVPGVPTEVGIEKHF